MAREFFASLAWVLLCVSFCPAGRFFGVHCAEMAVFWSGSAGQNVIWLDFGTKHVVLLFRQGHLENVYLAGLDLGPQSYATNFWDGR